ncbi:hypothetical protein GCM10010170_071000 [Dactylosporangium salmoneum]|uniref:HTH luxR-type domain-containing protein n=1 Tax=Dactylosporangium salmoneum TaxID=53361 RepID=A0ABN3H5W7_9ACTN
MAQAGSRTLPLHGRHDECQAIDELTATVRTGLSATLVLVGEAGIGKTRLLEHAAGAAADLRVARVVGVEPERRLAYAALHRLLRPYLDRIDRLPGPQRDALAGAFGLVAGVQADRFLVGLAVLTLLADVARSLPLVCLVDDAHWLDPETVAVLAFVARRLHADSVGVLIAARDEPGLMPALDGLPTLTVAGLPSQAACDLLAQAAPGRIAPPVAARMVAETRGNPLALIELTAELSADQLAGGASLPDRLPLSDHMEAHFLRHVRTMPAAAGLRLEQAASGLHTPTMRAAAQQTKATLAWFGGGVATVVSAMMLEAATDPELPAELSHGILFEALTAAMLSRQHTAGTTIADVAHAARRAPGRDRAPASTTQLLLDALATRVLDGFVPAVPHLRAATAVLRDNRELAHGSIPFAMVGNWVAEELLDDEGYEAILRHAVSLARERGALHALDAALHGLAAAATWAGDFAQADNIYAEAADVGAMTGTGDNGAAAWQIELLAWRGEEAPARAAADAAFSYWEARRGYGVVGNHARYSLAILELGHGRYADALAWTLPGLRDDVVGPGNRMLPNLIEAAARAGDRPSAEAALARLAERANASGTAWALGVLARSRALLTDDDGADALYREAAEHLAGSRMVTELARTHLLHGEWLRRRKRRTEARRQLGIAHDAFTGMGAAAFAERARVELLATGQHARTRAVPAGHDLTPQEARVAALAAAGATNAEIATQLFVTDSTVEYHLNKIFRKLGLTSRRQLAGALRPPPE